MIRRIFLLTLLAVLGLALASCAPAPDEQTLIDANANTQLAILQLTVIPDTSIPLNTVGQKINFKYDIKNTGGAGIAGVAMITGATAICPALTTVGNLNDSLDTEETVTCTSEYLITQADLDRGSVTFIFTATINGVNSAPITITVPLTKPQVLTLTVSANPTTYDQAARQIIFTYVIKNNGGAILGPGQFSISDALISSAPFNCGDVNATIGPTATLTCTATYTVSAADVNSVSVTSIATASGGGTGPSQPVNTTINKVAVPAPTNPANLVAGSTISHTVIDGDWQWQIARCYGADPNRVVAANTQLANPAFITPGMIISVPNIGSNGTIYGTPCVVKHTVKAGDTWESIALLYNADPAILKIANSNTMAVGSEINIPRNSAGTTGVPTKALSLTITANAASYEQAGQQIIYTYVIKNSGTTTLGPAQFTVTDTLISATPFNCGNAGTSLASNATVTCSATRAITEADMNSVSITNVATATGGGVGPSQSATFTLNKGLKALTLTTSPNVAAYDQAGQQITYTYVIKNNGTSTLGPTQFTVSDSLISPTAFNCGAPNTSLAAGATATCTMIYTITATDMGSVSITNNATASGAGVGPSQPATSTITKAVKALTLTTTVNPPAYNQLAQQIIFTYVIKNSGNVNLGPAQFTVSDTLVSPTPINCGDANASLAPNATLTCTGTRAITEADMSSVSITSMATASGGGVGPSQPATVTVLKQ